MADEAAIFIMMIIPSYWAGSAGGPRARDLSLLRFEARKGGGLADEAVVYVLMITNPGEWAGSMNGPCFCNINLSCLRQEGGCGHGSR